MLLRGTPVNAGQEEAEQREEPSGRGSPNGLGGRALRGSGAGVCHRAVPLGPHPVTHGMRTPREGARPQARCLPAALPTGEGQVLPSVPKVCPRAAQAGKGTASRRTQKASDGRAAGRRTGGCSGLAVCFPFIVSVLFKLGKHLLLLSLLIIFHVHRGHLASWIIGHFEPKKNFINKNNFFDSALYQRQCFYVVFH